MKKICIFGLTFVIILLQTFNVFCQQKLFTDIPGDAYEAYQAEKYDLAIQKLKEKEGFNESAILLNFAGYCAYLNIRYDSAAGYYDRAIQINDSDTSALVRSYLGKIDVNLRNAEVSMAITNFEKVKALDANGNYMDNPDVQLRKVSLSYFTDYANSLEHVKELMRTMPDGHPEKFSLYLYFLDLSMISTLSKGDSLLNAANQYISKYHPNDTFKDLKIKFHRAYYLSRIGEYQESLQLFNTGIRPLLEGRTERWAQFLTSEYYRMAGFPLQALDNNIELIQFSEKFIELAPKFYPSDHYRFSEVYKRLSDAYYQLGRDAIADEYLSQTIKIDLRSEDYFGYRKALYNKGLRYFYKSDYAEAIQTFKEFLNLYQPEGRKTIYETYVLHIIAMSYRKLGDPEKALVYQDSFIDKNNNRYLSIQAYGVKYSILRELGRYEEAVPYLEKTLKYIEENASYQYFNVVIFLNTYLQDLIKDGEYEEALQIASKVLDANSELLKNGSGKQPEFYRLLVQTIYYHAKTYELLFEKHNSEAYIDSAYQYYLTGLNNLNKVKKEYKSPRDRQQNVGHFERTYHSFIRMAYLKSQKSGDSSFKELAFVNMESYLSTQLLDELKRNLTIQQTVVPDSLTLLMESLKRQASRLSSQIAQLESRKNLSVTDSVRMQSLKLALTNNTIENNSTLKYLEKNYTNYYEASYESQLTTLQEAMASLKDDEAMIEYLVDTDAVYAILLTRKKSSFLRLKKVDQQMISTFRDLVRPDDLNSAVMTNTDEYRQIAFQLYDILLREAEDKLSGDQINKLTIIADRNLNFVPFELLITAPGNDGSTYGELPYLFDKYQISYAYSASVLNQQRSKVPDNRYEMLAYAPSYGDKASGLFRSSGETWTELLFNEEEVDNILTHYSGESVKGFEASEKNFMDQYDRYSILHLAMHAKVNLEDPQRSKLIFAPSNDSLNDGHLHSFELYNLKVDNQLTVLSACNTGSGELVKGEGIMSLARAFTYAGSKSVVMSHWQVDDQSTNYLMNAFYGNLSQGSNKSEALRRAKLDYLAEASPNKQHPFYWGAFVMIGDDSPIPPSEENQWIWWALAGLVIFIILMAVIRRKRKTT